MLLFKVQRAKEERVKPAVKVVSRCSWAAGGKGESSLLLKLSAAAPGLQVARALLCLLPLLFPVMRHIHCLRTLGPLLMTAVTKRAVPLWARPHCRGEGLSTLHNTPRFSEAGPCPPHPLMPRPSCPVATPFLNCPCATKSLPACLEPRTLFPSDFSKAWPGV